MILKERKKLVGKKQFDLLAFDHLLSNAISITTMSLIILYLGYLSNILKKASCKKFNFTFVDNYQSKIKKKVLIDKCNESILAGIFFTCYGLSFSKQKEEDHLMFFNKNNLQCNSTMKL
ncbi:hypothetical protein RFI_35808 [Reticulomyxa filosa]|uniref:Uncharacterized protein n=1 Tax=Reticulomyxa filosa TaxID=46433 RepID=X6LKG6_RETFI|nr:hypothetical protein RFI_35808 [Reticulomyxa filosa]|eukprot:ETO01632.1 hypothetical protein RFI_35808 [Reticulomyxa filosa]